GQCREDRARLGHEAAKLRPPVKSLSEQLQLVNQRLAQAPPAVQPEPGPAQNPPDETQIKVFTLRNAKAVDAERIVNQLFRREIQSIVADRRTNSVIVRGSAADLNVIFHILTRLDELEESGRIPQAASVASRENPSSSVPIADLRARYDDMEKAAATLARQIRELNAAPEAHKSVLKDLDAQ